MMTEKHDERPKPQLTEALKLGPSALLYIQTPQGKAWLAQELKKQDGVK